MRFDCSYAVSISLEELEKLLPKNALELITSKCHVDSICDLNVKSFDTKSIILFSCEV